MHFFCFISSAFLSSAFLSSALFLLLFFLLLLFLLPLLLGLDFCILYTILDGLGTWRDKVHSIPIYLLKLFGERERDAHAWYMATYDGRLLATEVYGCCRELPGYCMVLYIQSMAACMDLDCFFVVRAQLLQRLPTLCLNRP